MKLTIGTARLQALLNKAVKGAGCNNLLPMTGLIAIKLHDGVLTLTTTDATNYLSLVEKDVSGDEFYVAVQIELFAKLVAKMTCDEVTLEVVDNHLNVIGNGSYQIEIEIEDDGSPIKLPNPSDNFDKSKQIGTVDSNVILKTITSIKPALATSNEYPWYTSYYINDRIVATDTYTVADYSAGFLSEAKLISPRIMDLLGLLVGEISVFISGEKILFECEKGTVYGVIVQQGIDKYSIDSIEALVQQEFYYSCKIVKSTMLNLLDRLSLFVGIYDNGKITLSFGKDGLDVISKYASETIKYVDAEKVGEFVCSIDVETLITQIKAQSGSELIIEYGKDNALKIVDGEITSVLALLEE